MGSDLARISFDRTRGYRSVIVQQGRVTLEADSNEASTIAAETLRHETIDIVGPAGTPDQGYGITAGAGDPSDFVVGHGIMYVGGWRVTLQQDEHLSSQPDWLNLPPGQPDWTNLPATTQARNNRLIALLVTEQSIGAVEDTALLEVALGGPDTAARSRLIQHFLAVPVVANRCAPAAKELDADLAYNGLKLDPDTRAVTCGTSLLVSFFPPPAPPDPCTPAAGGGYLGADNQLVRVTVASYDPTKQTGTLLWGWNNASTLFRAAVAVAQTATQTATLTLSPPPIDAAHTPQQGQAIEVLRTECVVGNPADQNYVAAPQGQTMVLPLTTSSFNAVLNQLILPGMLPADYTTEPHSLFVRLWQAEVPFTSGQSVQLDSASGLAVTVTVTAPTTALPNGAFITATPYWQFAVRPNTPTQVYPVRYLEGPQPPDGPRQWLCDLAVVSSVGNIFTLLEDCRGHFIPLIDQVQTTCCGVVLGPQDVIAQGGLQAVVDAQAKNRASVSLRPGTYQLPAPLALTTAHNNLTLEGCGAGVLLTADPNALANFTPGLITINGATGVSLRRLGLRLPQAPVAIPGAVPPAPGPGPAFSLVTMCGISVALATGLTIEDCIFDARAAATVNAIAGCIFAQGNCNGMRLHRNQFLGGATGTIPTGVLRLTAGLWQSPAAAGTLSFTTTSVNIANPSFPSVDHRLDDSQITDNVFTGLTLAVLVIAQLGLVRCTNNRVRQCCGGIWFVEASLGSSVEVNRRALADEAANNANATLARNLRMSVQPTVLASAMTYANLLSRPSTPPSTLSTQARQVLEADFATRGGNAYSALTANLQQMPFPAASAAAAAISQAPGPAAATHAGPTIDPAVLAQNRTALDMLGTLGVAVEQAGTVLQPTLYLLHNDVELVPFFQAPDAKITEPALPGLMSVCTQGAVSGSLFFQGNRVEVPTIDSIAMVSFWGAKTIVTGNQFYQLSAGSTTLGNVSGVPCAIVLTDSANFLAVMGNIVHQGWAIYPPRVVADSLRDAWEFLNTVG